MQQDDETPMVPFVPIKVSIPSMRARSSKMKRQRTTLTRVRKRVRPKAKPKAAPKPRVVDPAIAVAPPAAARKRIRMEFGAPPPRAPGVCYVEFKEYNGWEKETWRTYIPLECNKKMLRGLRAICKHINFQNGIDEEHRKRHKEWEEREKGRAEAYFKEYKQTKDPLALALGHHVQSGIAEGMVCAGCTKFTLDLDTTYSEAECHVRCDSLDRDNGYMFHTFLKDAELDRTKLNQLAKWVRTKDPEKVQEAFQELYKGGIRDMFK